METATPEFDALDPTASMTDAQIVARLRRNRRARTDARYFSDLVPSGWDYHRCRSSVLRSGAADEFGIGRRRLQTRRALA